MARSVCAAQSVIDTLQSRECLVQYADGLDPDLHRAASEFVRALDSRRVADAAPEYVDSYGRCNGRKPRRR